MNKENFEKAIEINKKITDRQKKVSQLTNWIESMQKNIQIVTEMAEKSDDSNLDDYDRNHLFVSDEELSTHTAFKSTDAFRLHFPACDIFRYIIVGMHAEITDLHNEIDRLQQEFAEL